MLEVFISLMSETTGSTSKPKVISQDFKDLVVIWTSRVLEIYKGEESKKLVELAVKNLKMIVKVLPRENLMKVFPGIASAFFRDLTKANNRISSKGLQQVVSTIKSFYQKLFHNSIPIIQQTFYEAKDQDPLR